MNCAACQQSFTPKPQGHRALYCSARCKDRAYQERARCDDDARLRKRAARKRSYQQTKKYPERLERHQARGREYRRQAREFLANYKMLLGCVDCGFRSHHSALQLDHEGVKSVSISDARSSIKRLLTEIYRGKCKVRCANCHAIKTWERKQNEKA